MAAGVFDDLGEALLDLAGIPEVEQHPAQVGFVRDVAARRS